MSELTSDFKTLLKDFKGELKTDNLSKILYATDASAYREIPMGVAFPTSESDVEKLVKYAAANHIPLIPRTAGTSLAGQVVGSGLVVDVSRYMNAILEVNQEEKWVKLQPGVVRDELNRYLEPYNLYFGPETSTANRAMVGGMVGNNSCGSNSVVYGSTRDHLLEIKGFLSDGSPVHFKSLSQEEFEEKCKLDNLEGALYKNIYEVLASKDNQKLISDSYPKASIPRRNTGYALDILMDAVVFGNSPKPFNFCKLIAGSEGTLVFITEIKLALIPPPPAFKILVCAHFETIYDSLKGNLIGLKYKPTASELMDHYVLESTKNNREYRNYRFFVKDDPAAILVTELSGNNPDEVEQRAENLIKELQSQNLGYHYPTVTGDDIKKVWSLRKAGLGLLSNIPGDAKPAPVIEDTAVDVADLPDYIQDFNKILDQYGLYCVHYAHAGSGELHLRPLLNLKTEEGNQLFRTIATEIARLVKKYKGSLSGEHGDGRLRGEFIPFMIGEECFELVKKVKHIFDPHNLFNPGKIVDTPSMNTSLRYTPGQETRELPTQLDFSDTQGYLRAAEQCNGSGDCRKLPASGGTMCPSYMATLDEKDTTRARANVLREVLTNTSKENPFDSPEIREAMDLCLSCKGCKSECPSNVDVGKLKAEFQYHYYESNGIPFRTRVIAGFTAANRLASILPGFYNFFVSNTFTAGLFKKFVGFAPKRSLPKLDKTTLRGWYRKMKSKNFGVPIAVEKKDAVYLFIDEFTNYNDVAAGKAAIQLLTFLGYEVRTLKHAESGRSFLSKGLLEQARTIARKNVHLFTHADPIPVIGIEPSAILSFRDEYIDLLRGQEKENAKKLAERVFLLEEFITSEFEKGNIDRTLFTSENHKVRLHGHCHQKALASVVPTKKMLSIPKNYKVQLIPSGCCGMAGSFGYEEEHYAISMDIGELVLFPEVRKEPPSTLIAAPGTSCRHQIWDGTKREALHPAQILWNAIKKES